MSGRTTRQRQPINDSPRSLGSSMQPSASITSTGLTLALSSQGWGGAAGQCRQGAPRNGRVSMSWSGGPSTLYMPSTHLIVAYVHRRVKQGVIHGKVLGLGFELAPASASMAPVVLAKTCAFTSGMKFKAQVHSMQQQQRYAAIRVSALAQKAEYIWHDGQEGEPQKGLIFNEMRSKTKCITTPITSMKAEDFPRWSFDGSSTDQAEGNNSDCILQPVRVMPDPVRGEPNVLVMCEILDSEGNPHPTNTRALLRDVIDSAVEAEECMYGFEQEYTMLDRLGNVHGWPKGGYPAPQGPFYCGAGAESVYGRPLAEAHLDACIKAGIRISGINAEVMPGQWEFQIGPVGPLEVGDEVMLARWLLHRLGEEWGIVCTLHPKPVKGDWNGTGAHTNFSTKSMREEGGLEVINAAIEKLSKTHAEHISQYGTGNEQRLTGKHETCDIDTFRSGVADRGAAIRIPLSVQLAGKGYLEDRRPAANVDPYTVARLLIKSVLK